MRKILVFNLKKIHYYINDRSVKLTKYNYVNVLSFDLVTKSGLNVPLRLHIIKPKHTFKNN